MTGGRYKQFLRVIEKWPLDTAKGKSRDLGVLLRERFARQFKDGDMSEIPDPVKCDKILKSLQHIVDDKHKLKYQCDIKQGAICSDIETAEAAVSEAGMKQLKENRSPLLASSKDTSKDVNSVSDKSEKPT